MKAELVAFGVGLAMGAFLHQLRLRADAEYAKQLADLLGEQGDMGAYVVPDWAVADPNGPRVCVHMAYQPDEMLWI